MNGAIFEDHPVHGGVHYRLPSIPKAVRVVGRLRCSKCGMQGGLTRRINAALQSVYCFCCGQDYGAIVGDLLDSNNPQSIIDGLHSN